MDRGEEDGCLHTKPKTAKMLSKRVGSMPSLHKLLQHSAIIAESSSPMHSPESVLMPPSPDHSSSASDVGISRYASAINLRDLDEINDNDDKEHNDQDDEGGDKMIDRKADDFIARFYEQMRIQNHNEMIRRQGKHYHHRRRHSSREGAR